MAQLLVLPDNTVLVNFAKINRMDLLERLVRHGTWCASVAMECDRSAKQPGLESMANAHKIFGAPLRPENGREHVTTQTFRTRLAKPGDGNLRHLGEAETLAIMTCRSLHGIFATDDKSVLGIAQEAGIQVVTTFDLLRAACRGGMLDADTLWSHVQTLRQEERGSPPRVHDRPSFDEWLSSK